jgi:DNA-binding GntR family transcriptional regulator
MEFKPGISKRHQVAADMRRRIESDEWPRGMALSGVFELGREYGCSMEVVRQAEHILAGQGWLNRPRQGLWTRVAGKPEQDPLELLVDVQNAHQHLGRKLEALSAALVHHAEIPVDRSSDREGLGRS